MLKNVFIFIISIGFLSCGSKNSSLVEGTNKKNMENSNQIDPTKVDTCVLGGGCFWCLDAVYRRLPGVLNVVSGYSNGKIANPTYREVCSGYTGCVEVVKIMFDTTKTSFAEILTVFWRIHNPTTLNKQGNDEGTQYRSGIYYRNNEQKELALYSLKAAEDAKLWDGKIVTEILPVEKYSDAEDYHQNYFEINPDQPYCIYVVGEKVKKFEEYMKKYKRD